MNRKEAIQLIEMLDWKRPRKDIEYAMKQLRSINDEMVDLLVLPEAGKDKWEFSARTLQGLGYQRIKLVLPRLLEWLQDVNWPGARTALGILGTVPCEVLLPHIEDALSEASEEGDEL